MLDTFVENRDSNIPYGALRRNGARRHHFDDFARRTYNGGAERDAADEHRRRGGSRGGQFIKPVVQRSGGRLLQRERLGVRRWLQRLGVREELDALRDGRAGAAEIGQTIA